MYHIGPSDGTVSCCVLRLEVYGATDIILKKISHNFQKKCQQLLGEFHSTFKRISHNFKKNLTHFLGEFHKILK